jgi:hypothetical protein
LEERRARPGNITRITRNHADLAANQQLKVRVMHNSILRTITRITGAFPQSGSDSHAELDAAGVHNPTLAKQSAR